MWQFSPQQNYLLIWNPWFWPTDLNQNALSNPWFVLDDADPQLWEKLHQNFWLRHDYNFTADWPLAVCRDVQIMQNLIHILGNTRLWNSLRCFVLLKFSRNLSAWTDPPPGRSKNKWSSALKCSVLETENACNNRTPLPRYALRVSAENSQSELV